MAIFSPRRTTLQMTSTNQPRRFKRQWRDAAAQYARTCWHTPEYRYWSMEGKSRAELAETAAEQYRVELQCAYSRSVKHPRSRKAVEQIRDAAKQLASIGLYILSASEQKVIITWKQTSRATLSRTRQQSNHLSDTRSHQSSCAECRSTLKY